MNIIIDRIISKMRKQACLHLHIPHAEMWLTLEMTDKDGKVILRRRQRSKSWVANAYTEAAIAMMDTRRSTACTPGVIGIKTITGSCMGNEYNQWPGLPHDSMTSASGNRENLRGGTAETNRGIVIGTGTGAESFTDYKLGTLVAHGYGTNEACYQVQDAYSLAYVAGTKTYTATHSRIINNNSDANITLGEVGLYGRVYYASAYSSATFMVARDVLSPTVTFYDKAQLRVTYEISMVYPA